MAHRHSLSANPLELTIAPRNPLNVKLTSAQPCILHTAPPACDGDLFVIPLADACGGTGAAARRL
jgi:hypothetical protein